MSTNPLREIEYPYAARYGELPPASHSLTPRWDGLRRAARRWLRRLTIALTVAGALVLAAGCFLAYRLAAQASFVAEMRARGCELAFVHQLPGETDPLPFFVRDWLGDDVWSEIASVTYGENRYGWYWSTPSENVPGICATCAGLDKLRSFSITSEAFKFDLIKAWPQLDQLEQLEIHSSHLTDADLARISQMPNLKHLTLTSSNISGGAAARLSQLPALETLELRSIRKGGGEQSPSTAFPALRRLVIEEAEVDDAMLLGLGRLPELREVVLSKATIGDAGLAHLLSGGNVQSIILNDTKDNLEEAVAIRCPEPQVLHLVEAEITDAGLQALAGLEAASIVLDKTAVSDAGLQAIGRVQGLRYLSLRETKITGTGVVHLAAVRTLAKLDLQQCPLTTDGAAALAAAKIAELIVQQTPLTDEQLLLFAGSDAINRLDVRGTHVTADGVRALYEARRSRQQAAGREESLIVLSDFADIIEKYVAPSRLRSPDGGDETIGGLGQSSY